MTSWRVMSVKLNIAKKIAGLEITALNRGKMWHISKLIALIFKGALHHSQRCLRKQRGREEV